MVFIIGRLVVLSACTTSTVLSSFLRLPSVAVGAVVPKGRTLEYTMDERCMLKYSEADFEAFELHSSVAANARAAAVAEGVRHVQPAAEVEPALALATEGTEHNGRLVSAGIDAVEARLAPPSLGNTSPLHPETAALLMFEVEALTGPASVAE